MYAYMTITRKIEKKEKGLLEKILGKKDELVLEPSHSEIVCFKYGDNVTESFILDIQNGNTIFLSQYAKPEPGRKPEGVSFSEDDINHNHRLMGMEDSNGVQMRLRWRKER